MDLTISFVCIFLGKAGRKRIDLGFNRCEAQAVSWVAGGFVAGLR